MNLILIKLVISKRNFEKVKMPLLALRGVNLEGGVDKEDSLFLVIRY